MIVGTAGHIDHGKTTLVRALTGVDTDRLPEEKRARHLDRAGLCLPARGRRRRRSASSTCPATSSCVHTMLAGATGIDFALLVVAADDGVMPQTREHLDDPALLGMRARQRRADQDRSRRCRERPPAAVEPRSTPLLAPTPLAGSPVFPLSATTGEGLDALRAHLVDAAREAAFAGRGGGLPHGGRPRFTLAGVGTVVTGSAWPAGSPSATNCVLLPGERRVRVRGIHAQNMRGRARHAGQRCALNLAGVVAKDEVRRGHGSATPASRWRPRASTPN